MITRLTSVTELKQIFVEGLLNRTSKLTKVSRESINNGVAYGIAKIAQKALKDIALVETHIFPDFAFEQHLDQVASDLGIADRFGASQSSTFVRLVASPGTVYTSVSQKFIGSGVTFDLEVDVTVGSLGFAYGKVRAQTSGSRTNVDANTITTVAPIPAGHLFVTNEFQATGGRDIEDDNLFRIRVKEGANLAARGTLAYLTQTFNKLNSNVLKVYYQGINGLNQPILAISTQNGIDLTVSELDDIKQRGAEFFSITELDPIGGSPNVELKNIEYEPIDVDFRVELVPSANVDTVRQSVQIGFNKEVDFRFWIPGNTVQWDNLLQIVKDVENVRSVPDQFFFPPQDVVVPSNKLPRFRGFIMRDLEGNIITNLAGTLNPIFYPADPDFSFQQTVLNSI